MSLGLFDWLLALGVPLGLGAALAEILGLRAGEGRLVHAARIWCLGALLLGGVVFATANLGLSPRLVTLVPPLLLLGAGLSLGAFLRRRWRDELEFVQPRRVPVPTSRARRIGMAVGIGLLALVALDRIAAPLGVPIHSGDEAHLWASRARVLFESGGFGELYRAEFERRILVPSGLVPFFVQHPDYPPLGPLLQTWIYAVADRVTWAENRVPLQLFGLATLLMVAGALSSRVRWPIAIGAAWLLLGSKPMHDALGSAYVDLVVAAGLLMATDAWLRLRSSGETRWMALLASGLALALFAKHEGALIAVAFAAGVAVDLLRDRWRRPEGLEPIRAPRGWAFLWLALPLAAVLAVWLFNRAYGHDNDLVSQNQKGRPFWVLFVWQFGDRAPAVATYFVERVLFVSSHARTIPLLLLLVLLARPAALLRGPALAPAVALAAATAGYFIVFVGSPHDLAWHLDTAAGRVLFQLVPTATLLLGILLDDAWTAWQGRLRDTDD